MGYLHNQTLGSSQPEVTQWESTAQLSSAVYNTVIALGVLTFALQLCLALFFMLRCWRLDNRIREALKDPDTKLISPSIFQPAMYKQASYQLCDDAASSSASTAAAEQYEPATHPPFGPSIPWDLVQS